MNFRLQHIYLLFALSCFVIPVNAEEIEQDSLSLSPSYLDERYTDDLSKLKQRKIIRALIVPGRTDFTSKMEELLA